MFLASLFAPSHSHNCVFGCFLLWPQSQFFTGALSEACPLFVGRLLRFDFFPRAVFISKIQTVFSPFLEIFLPSLSPVSLCLRTGFGARFEPFVGTLSGSSPGVLHPRFLSLSLSPFILLLDLLFLDASETASSPPVLMLLLLTVSVLMTRAPLAPSGLFLFGASLSTLQTAAFLVDSELFH